MKKYLDIARHYDECFTTHGDTHLGVDWPNEKDMYIRYEIMTELVKKNKKSSLLDFGCGTAGLYNYISKNKKNIEYSGLDINLSFYEKCKLKFPEISFYHKDILVDDNIPNFDYIICNGTFTEKLNLSNIEMMDFFESIIKKLWEKCNIGLAFNLMSKHVDWEREDLFHVSLDELGWFLKTNLSRNFLIRNDYKLYEFTTYVYKN